MIRDVLPTALYPCGAIYPTSPAGEGIDPASEVDGDWSAGDTAAAPATSEERSEEPAVIRRYVPPSSIGFSFFVKGTEVQFQAVVSAVRYSRNKQRDGSGQFLRQEWRRTAMATADTGALDFRCPQSNISERRPIFKDRASVDVRWRRFHDGWIVTLSLCNACEVDNSTQEFAQDRAANTLFAAKLSCVIESGQVGDYPRVDPMLLDEEEQEIELQYANQRIYAVGHGAAVDWNLDDNGSVRELISNTLPIVEVPQITTTIQDVNSETLALAELARVDDDRTGLLAQLSAFIDAYDEWVATRKEELQSLADADQPAGSRITKRMAQAVKRMRAGLQLLVDDEQARTAFAIANQAIFDQMRQYDSCNGGVRADAKYQWRPFQLGFLLTVLESVTDADSDWRDVVDLIWFPTGGGKTEAYLGLIAFQIAYRRLKYPSAAGGTTVLMRYTLRLLAQDQFLRATRLICALELIRRDRSDLGDEPISIGMWVGSATSPNTYRAALERMQASPDSERPVKGLVIDKCPWCAQSFKARQNYQSSDRQFRFVCTNEDCDFGRTSDGVLPCNVVDEALYKDPPTLIVATLDKFARLAWEERTNTFFGVEGNRPPELIIQDELHLIAGALGSVAGLYEAALDTVIRQHGLYPKYVASTATIRMAKQQVRSLYGREVAVFPPPGLRHDDSWFARTIPLDEKPGRMYVGYLAPLLNRQQCMIPLAAALLRAPELLFAGQENEQELLDAWWTQVIYHGSLRGVGNSRTVLEGGVRDHMRLLAEKDRAPTGNQGENASQRQLRLFIEELTSRKTAEENAEVFSRLRCRQGDEGYLDSVLATNMVAVGLDVSRLALMVVNGQPLTTAEYIQASSRVGRGDVPGIVVANYYRDQARSLSHYEDFRSYHEAFYRFVEPASVTPYTYQARLRALHAALVIVIRHSGLGLLTNKNAAQFKPETEAVAHVMKQLQQRCTQADKNNAEAICRHIESLANAWQAEAERCNRSRRLLCYQVRDDDRGSDRLLFNHDDKLHGLWPTLQSMRHVEDSALFKAL